MNILLVGAGAVGLVYGRHLQLGGADVTFYVREKYRDDVAAGFTMHVLNAVGRGTHRFEGLSALTTPEEVAAQTWDQIWLCVSATAIRGEWLAPFLAATGDATIVALQPGLDDGDRLAAHVPSARIVRGMISLVSYQAPLPGEDRAPGIAYWFPPMSPSPFSGEGAQSIVRALDAGGCPAKVHPQAELEAARGSAILMPHLVALEAEGWSLAALRKGEHVKRASAAAQEALAVVAAFTNTEVPGLMACLVRPCLMRLLLGVAPWAVPFPLEVYLKYHFTKVGDQTRMMIQTYIDQGIERGLPTENLEALSALL